jgi:hypothetical protein
MVLVIAGVICEPSFRDAPKGAGRESIPPDIDAAAF